MSNPLFDAPKGKPREQILKQNREQYLPTQSQINEIRRQLEGTLNLLYSEGGTAKDLALPSIGAEAFQGSAAILGEKAKVGVVFGDGRSGPWGSSKNHGVIFCKIYKNTHGGKTGRGRMEQAWLGALLEHYKSFASHLKESDQRHYAQRLEEVRKVLKNAITFIKDARSSKGSRKRNKNDPASGFHGLRGAHLMQIVPVKLRQQLIIDYIDAWFIDGQPNQHTELRAHFVVPQDSIPYVWKKPEEASVRTTNVSEKINQSMLDSAANEWTLTWNHSEYDDEHSRWSPVRDEDGNIQTKKVIRRKGNKRVIVECPVYNLSDNEDYQKEQRNFDKELQQVKFLAQADSAAQYIAKEIRGNPSNQAAILAIMEKFGTFAGKKGTPKQAVYVYLSLIRYVDVLRRPALRFLKVLEEYKTAGRDPQVEQEVLEAGREVIPSEFLTGTDEEDLRSLRMIGKALLTAAEVHTQAGKIAEPMSLYSDKMVDRGLMPSVEAAPVANSRMAVREQEDGKTVSKKKIVRVNIPTQDNPMHIPRMFPPISGLKGKASWPDEAGKAFTRGVGIVESKDFKDIAWSTETMSKKRQHLEDMKMALADAEAENRRAEILTLRSDIQVVEQNLYLDELGEYVKKTMGFGLVESASSAGDQPEYKTVGKGGYAPPPLFHIKGEDGLPEPVTLEKLLNQSAFDKLLKNSGSDGSHLDVISKEDNYGFATDLPDYMETMLKQQKREEFRKAGANKRPITSARRLDRMAKLRYLLAQESENELYFDNEGKQYNSFQELERELQSQGMITVDEAVEHARQLEAATKDSVEKLQSAGEDLGSVIQGLIEDLDEIAAEAEPEEESGSLPNEQDDPFNDEAPEPLRFPVPQQPMQLAAGIRVRKFTK